MQELRFLNDKEVATALGVGRRTVHRWVDEGILPPPVHLGRLVRWSHDDLEAALKLLKQRSRKATRRGRPSREEEATASKLGMTVPKLRAQRAGGAA